MLGARCTGPEAAEAVLREGVQAGEGGDGWVCDEPFRDLRVSDRSFEVNTPGMGQCGAGPAVDRHLRSRLDESAGRG